MRFVLGLAAWAAGWLPTGVVQRLYRLGPISLTLRRLINQAAPAERVDVEVAGGLLRGATFRLDLRREKHLWLGTIEPAVQRLIQTHIRPGMVVYDVGANLGYFTVALAHAVGPEGEVTAFEPLPVNLDRLSHSLVRNQVADRVQIVAAAVSEAGGRGRFQIHESTSVGRLAGQAGRLLEFSGSIDVDTISLDEYAYAGNRRPPQWIKLDIEGGEAQALEGASRLLMDGRPEWLIELHGDEAAEAVFRLLRRHDYRVLNPKPPHRPLELEQIAWRDHIWARPPLQHRDGS